MKQAGWILSSLLIVCSALSSQASPNSIINVPGGSLNPFWLKPQKGTAPVVYKVSDLSVQSRQVTNQEFQEFVDKNPQWGKKEISPLYAEINYLDQFKEDMTLKDGVLPDAPVTSVSWFAARAYCQSLGLRLPSTIEWEYLAAASEKKPDANKDPVFLERILNWYSQPKTQVLPKVQSIYKNLYGMHDMHALVWEWVEDFNSSMVTGESREDSSLNRDLFCGAGSINSGDKENYAAFMRFAFRSSLKGKSSVWNLGFRCVKGKDS